MAKAIEQNLTERLRVFIEQYYYQQLMDAVKKGKESLEVSFSDLAKFDLDIADALLHEPQKIIEYFEAAIKEFDLPKEYMEKRINPRFSNLPKNQSIKIRNIRSKHLGKLVHIEGLIRQASDVRPKVTRTYFLCPACNQTIIKEQTQRKFQEPEKCPSCGKKGRFTLQEKRLVDMQRLLIEESPESLTGGEQPKRIAAFLSEDLLEPQLEKKRYPGNKIRMIGVVREVQMPLATGGQSTKFDLLVDVNHFETVDNEFDEIDISEKDKKEIEELAKDSKIYEKLVKSIAPSIYGHDDVKLALALQLFGGAVKERSDGTRMRGDMHVFLVGDPGAGKSELLKYIANLAPKARYVSGKGTTGAGITATVVKDEFMRGWALEAGALVLANKGIICLHPDSKVIANNQIKRIGDIFDENKTRICRQGKESIEYHNIYQNCPALNTTSMKSVNQTITKIARKKYSGKLIKLNFKSGFSVTLTPEHMLLEGNSLVWKEAHDFRAGESSIALLNLPMNSKDIYILDIIPDNWKVILTQKEKGKIKSWIRKEFRTLSEFNKKFGLDRHYLSGGKQLYVKEFKKILNHFHKYDRWKEIAFKYARKHSGEILKIAKITPQLGYVLGFLYGDGYIKTTERRTAIHIIQSVKNMDYINEYNKCWSSIFYKPMNYSEMHTTSEIRGKEVISNCRHMYYGSNLLGHLFNALIGKDLSNILSLNNETLKSFIAGVMDSDGYIGTKRNKDYVVQHVDFMMAPKNKTANLNFMLALRKLDCYSKIIKQKEFYLVEITGRADIKILKQEIEEYSVKVRKINVVELKKNLSSTSQKMPAEKVSEICRQIASFTSKSELLKKGLWSTIYRFKEQQIQPSRDQLLKIKSRINLPQNLNQDIEMLTGRDYFLDEIISTEEKDYDGYVYDLFVPELHNFIADGVVVHNCLDEMDKMTTEDRSAMHEAMEQQKITISKANVQACYSEDTEVLTEEGWKKYTEVGNLKIAQYNPQTSYIKFLPHKGLYVYNYKKKLIHFKNRRNDILVTPNHKMLAREYSQKSLTSIEAKDLKYNYIKFINSAEYIGQETKFFVLPAIKHKQNRVHKKYAHQHLPKKIPMELWLEFLGYYITEGGIETVPTIGIVQKKGENAEKIKKCLKDLTTILGCSLSEIDCKEYIRLKITQTQLYSYLKELGHKCYDKTLKLNFSKLTKKQLHILYNAMMLGDGSSDGKYFSCTSKKLSDEFQVICNLIGKSASQHTHYLEGYRGNRKTTYRVSISDKIQPSIRKKSIKNVSYRGKVYCFATDTGFFATRRNGKIAIQGNTLRAEASVLAAANPKFGRFDPYSPISQQIDLPSTLINRFDLIFPMRDVPDVELDTKIAHHVLELQRDIESAKPLIAGDMLRKYIAYAKQTCFPKLSATAQEEIANFYIDLRGTAAREEAEVKPIPISARQLQALVRLAEASARVRLSKTVAKRDAQRAIELLRNCMKAVGTDPETGKFDIDRITSGVTASQRSRIHIVKNIIDQLELKLGKVIPITDIVKEAFSEGVPEARAEEIINNLIKTGDLYSPRHGLVQKI